MAKDSCALPQTGDSLAGSACYDMRGILTIGTLRAYIEDKLHELRQHQARSDMV